MLNTKNPLIKYEQELVNILFQNNIVTFVSTKNKLNLKEIKIELHSLVQELKEKNRNLSA